MTSDADLEAIWRAFRRDPAELYKLVALVTASARLHAEELVAAARRAPAAEEPPARVGEPAEGRGGFLRKCPRCGAFGNRFVCAATDCAMVGRPDDPTGTDPAPRINPEGAW